VPANLAHPKETYFIGPIQKENQTEKVQRHASSIFMASISDSWKCRIIIPNQIFLSRANKETKKLLLWKEERIACLQSENGKRHEVKKVKVLNENPPKGLLFFFC